MGSDEDVCEFKKATQVHVTVRRYWKKVEFVLITSVRANET